MAVVFQEIDWKTRTRTLGSYTIYARELSIGYADDPRYWRWQKLPEDPEVEVAELIKISRLHVCGYVPMDRFSPGEKYEVLFILKRTKSARFSTVAGLNLKLPDGTEKNRIVNILALEPDQWVFVKVGTFTRNQRAGHIQFSLQIMDRTWKEGMFLGGVLIQHIG